MMVGTEDLRRRNDRPFGRSFRVGPSLEHIVIALVVAAMIAVTLAGVSTMRSKASRTACRADVAAVNQAVDIAGIQSPSGSVRTRLTDPQLRMGRLNGIVSADGLSVAKHGYTLTFNPVLGRVEGTLADGRANCGY